VILGGCAYMFSSTAEHFVVDPIEEMLKKVKLIATDPLEAQNIEDQDILAMIQIKKDKNAVYKKKDMNLETNILEKTIIKIGSLLALGFGEAGSNIIKGNIKSGGDINPMLPGKKVMAIYGFCDIRNFTDATEILQEGVMKFTNEIGAIVH